MFGGKLTYDIGVYSTYVRRMSAAVFEVCSSYVCRMFAVCSPYVSRPFAVYSPYFRRIFAIPNLLFFPIQSSPNLPCLSEERKHIRYIGMHGKSGDIEVKDNFRILCTIYFVSKTSASAGVDNSIYKYIYYINII